MDRRQFLNHRLEKLQAEKVKLEVRLEWCNGDIAKILGQLAAMDMAERPRFEVIQGGLE